MSIYKCQAMNVKYFRATRKTTTIACAHYAGRVLFTRRTGTSESTFSTQTNGPVFATRGGNTHPKGVRHDILRHFWNVINCFKWKET